MFRCVMVANRGEVALRILRSLREMDVEAVLACSAVDASHPPALAGRVVCVGPAEAEGSYLNSYELINAATACGADAIHPGYGFLSEDAGFARLCGEMGVGFVGPSPAVMESLDDKSAVCRMADGLGIPTLVLGVAREESEVAEMARRAGYPIVLKPVGGGGGRGIRTVERASELSKAWHQADLEVAASCRRGGIYVERYLRRARHLEVQVAGDVTGRVITFPPRDCSLQRRYQKWIEETPPPRLSARLEEALRRDARRFIEACGLTGIATVEFLTVGEDHFFLEVNARLQVEHTVTELITGWDLVRVQLELASGEELKKEADVRGHALQARVYLLGGEMEGKARLELPGGPGIRVDALGSEVSLRARRYDSLVAKVCAWAPNRPEAVSRLSRALEETAVRGAQSNLALLRSLVDNDDFRAGEYDSRTLEETLEG